MKKLLFLFSIAIMLFATSCSSDPTSKASVSFAMINHIADENNETTLTGGTYYFELDYMSNTATISIPALRLQSGEASVKLELKDIKFTSSSSKGTEFSLTNVVPYINGVQDPNYTIGSLYGQIYGTIVRLTYTIQQKKVIADLVQQGYSSTVFNVTDADGKVFTYSDATCSFVLNPYELSNASLSLYGIKFAQSMPVGLNMDFNKLTFAATPNGYLVTKDEIIPEISSTPYDKYKVTNFRAEITDNIAIITFDCMGSKVSATAQRNASTSSSN